MAATSLSRLLQRPIQKRTRLGAQIEKGQCGEVALASHNEMGSGFVFNGAEGELEVQPAEFRLGFGRVGLENLRQVLELLLDPGAKVGHLGAGRSVLGPFELFLQPVVRQNRAGATGRVRMLKDSDGSSKSG